MAKTLYNIIAPNEEDQIIQLFKHKCWEIDELNGVSLFNRFIKQYKKLPTAETRQMFLHLAKEYHYVSVDDYLKIIIGILSSVFKTDDREDVLVMPLLSIKEIRKIKSGTFMSYLFKSIRLKHFDNLAKKSVTILDNYEMLKAKITQNKILFLVDDYIGSGKQSRDAIDDVIKTLNSIQDFKSADIKKIYILTLYINEMGLKSVKDKIRGHNNFELIYGEKTSQKALEYSAVLNSVTDVLGSKESHLGFNDCGDLITLIRTPNNTIPLFRSKKSPFPR